MLLCLFFFSTVFILPFSCNIFHGSALAPFVLSESAQSQPGEQGPPWSRAEPWHCHLGTLPPRGQEPTETGPHLCVSSAGRKGKDNFAPSSLTTKRPFCLAGCWFLFYFVCQNKTNNQRHTHRVSLTLGVCTLTRAASHVPLPPSARLVPLSLRHPGVGGPGPQCGGVCRTSLEGD